VYHASVMTIRVLDSAVVARIAAGEVVERPAAVVKELVENSLDAGASRISVETRGGGVGLIQVADNGGGIPAAEMVLAFQRHATSKVTSATDLESISTLGFRGEALPSIAAVSEVELASCTADGAAGSFVRVEEGIIAGQGERARPPGTTVTVRNLFRTVPARLKFLRSTTTENSHIADIVSQYALAYPEVKFSLTIDDRSILATPGNGRPIDGVLAIYGVETARSMIEIRQDAIWTSDRTQGNITVSGLVGAPHLSRATRDYLSLFVNRRWISGRLLAKAVEDAYRGLLTVGRHPVAVINIDLPARAVDVNIHPAKSEVKFQNEQQVFGAVQRAVRGTIAEFAPVPLIEFRTSRRRPARGIATPAFYSPPLEGVAPGTTSSRPTRRQLHCRRRPGWTLSDRPARRPRAYHVREGTGTAGQPRHRSPGTARPGHIRGHPPSGRGHETACGTACGVAVARLRTGRFRLRRRTVRRHQLSHPSGTCRARCQGMRGRTT
jgi:DNA mismatch repair protein MutL